MEMFTNFELLEIAVAGTFIKYALIDHFTEEQRALMVEKYITNNFMEHSTDEIRSLLKDLENVERTIRSKMKELVR